MDAKTFFDALDEKIRKTGGNQRSHMFARLAMQAVADAYDLYEKSSEFGKTRKTATTEQIEKANKLIEMGITEAIYGRGRALLH